MVKMEQEIDGWITVHSYSGTVLELSLSLKAMFRIKLSKLCSKHCSWPLTLGSGAAEMSYFRSASGFTLRDRVRSSDKELRIELPILSITCKKKDPVEAVQASD